MTGIQKRIDRISFFWFNVLYTEKTELHQFSKETIFSVLIQNSPKRMHPCLCPLVGIDLRFPQKPQKMVSCVNGGVHPVQCELG